MSDALGDHEAAQGQSGRYGLVDPGRFVDRDAVFVFLNAQDVAAEAKRLSGVGFHAPGANYPARDSRGLTPFEALVQEKCSNDPTLQLMATRSLGTPICRRQMGVAEAAGLRLISAAFSLISDSDDEIVEAIRVFCTMRCMWCSISGGGMLGQ